MVRLVGGDRWCRWCPVGGGTTGPVYARQADSGVVARAVVEAATAAVGACTCTRLTIVANTLLPAYTRGQL